MEKSRLNPGGIASYWLTVHQLLPGETLAIVRAFCDAFEDCSLWSGVGLEWILVGSRGGIAPVPPERIARLFEQEPTRTELRRIALERPEHLLAQFLADSSTLRALAAHAPPLVDDFPRRLSATLPSGRAEPLYVGLLGAAASHERLRSSAWAAAVLPGALAAQGPQAFREREMLDALGYPELRPPGSSAWGAGGDDLPPLRRGRARAGSHPDRMDSARAPGARALPLLPLVGERSLRLSAAAALLALIALRLAWELWLAPLRPGGSLIALKALPLALPLGGILRGKRYTFQWSSMLILAYFAEGATRAWGDTGLSQKMAFLEVLLSLAFFVAAVSYARGTKARGHP